MAMNTIAIDLWGYDVEVEYDIADDSIDLLDYRFESEEAADDCGLYSESARARLEEELTRKVAEHERRNRAKAGWIAPYLEAKRKRFRDSL